MTFPDWVTHKPQQVILVPCTLVDKAHQDILRSSTVGYYPVIQTCLNSPHTSRKVKTFYLLTKNWLVFGNLKVAVIIFPTQAFTYTNCTNCMCPSCRGRERQKRCIAILNNYYCGNIYFLSQIQYTTRENFTIISWPTKMYRRHLGRRFSVTSLS